MRKLVATPVEVNDSSPVDNADSFEEAVLELARAA